MYDRAINDEIFPIDEIFQNENFNDLDLRRNARFMA